MSEATPGPSGDVLIREGGWNPKYARVLLIERGGDHALALVDGNGDGGEIELEYWQRDAAGGWDGGASSGFGPLDHMPAVQSWCAGEFVAAVGRVEPASVVTIHYCGNTHSRRANQFGLWGFVYAADYERPGELPIMADA